MILFFGSGFKQYYQSNVQIVVKLNTEFTILSFDVF